MNYEEFSKVKVSDTPVNQALKPYQDALKQYLKEGDVAAVAEILRDIDKIQNTTF